MDIHPAIAFFIPFFTGFLTSYLAAKKGRSSMWWFCWGFLFGLLGAIALYFFPNKKTQEAPAEELLQSAPVVPSEKLWFYLNEKNEQFGPISSQKLEEELHTGSVHHTTYVWHDEMEDWARVSDILQK